MKDYFEIEDREINCLLSVPDQAQSILKILKARGAPISGIFYLQITNGYMVSRSWRDEPANKTCFVFKKKDD